MSIVESSQELKEKKAYKTFKKFAKALNEAYRKEGDDVLRIEIDAEIFNDREMRWSYSVKNKP